MLPLQFNSPAHLVQTLKEYGTANKLPLSCGMHNGTINVHGSRGILLRIRPRD